MTELEQLRGMDYVARMTWLGENMRRLYSFGKLLIKIDGHLASIADLDDFDTFQANFLCYVARGGRVEGVTNEGKQDE